jgi:polysaccharide export outer membrane protein
MSNLRIALFCFTFVFSTAYAQSLRPPSGVGTIADDRARAPSITKSSEPLPSASPIDGQSASEEDYRIGPQDLIEVQVYGIEGLKREVRVNARGVISLPLVGQITVGGLTSQEAEALIATKYEKDYLREPQVSVFIKEFTSQRITIEGAVNKPGIYPIRGQTTLLQGIAIAGGQGNLADLNEVMVFRLEQGEKKTHSYDLTKIRAGEIEDPILINDDLVVVKRSKSRVVFKDSLFRDFLDAINPFNIFRQ